MIVISGSSGLIGSALAASFAARGEEVCHLVRRTPRAPGEIEWHPERGWIDAERLAGADAIVSLAGENIAQRWTRGARRRIRDSRVRGTSLLAHAAASLARARDEPQQLRKPRVMVSASAIGIYGDRGDEPLDEASAPGGGFLADVCRDWEAAAEPAAAAGVRVAIVRMAVVFARGGGVLPKMLAPFRVGVGGRVGSGRQWLSWIALADAVRAIERVLADETFSGPVNLAAPNPVQNAELVHTLGRVLRRPAVVPLPSAAVRLLFGRMGVETLLASQRVRPAKLLARGFEFLHPTLESALRAELS